MMDVLRESIIFCAEVRYVFYLDRLRSWKWQEFAKSAEKAP